MIATTSAAPRDPATDRRHARRAARAPGAHRFSTRAPLGHREPRNVGAAAGDDPDAHVADRRPAGAVARGELVALLVEVPQPEPSRREAREQRHHLPADHALDALAIRRAAVRDVLLRVGVDAAVAVEVGGDLDALGGRREDSRQAAAGGIVAREADVAADLVERVRGRLARLGAGVGADPRAPDRAQEGAERREDDEPEEHADQQLEERHAVRRSPHSGTAARVSRTTGG